MEETKAGHLSIERVLDKCKEETSVVPVREEIDAQTSRRGLTLKDEVR